MSSTLYQSLLVCRGFQKQNLDGTSEYKDPHTICGLLEIALKCCNPLNYPKVVGSSRTDKGVHALCNTVHVDLEGDFKNINSFSIAKTANVFFAYNDHDIRILKVQQVADDFHCRHKACGRKYLYRLAFPKPGAPFYEKTVIPYPVSEFKRCLFLQEDTFNVEAVKSACGLFLGEKDFRSFSSKSRDDREINTIRSLDTLELTPGRPMVHQDSLTEQYDFWDITCSSRSFLYHQVRRMVSSLLAYGQGRIKIADLQRMFDEPSEESWSVTGALVSSEGLFLTEIWYKAEDLAFSEQTHRQEALLHQLQEETHQILEKLKLPDTTILEKIKLRERLLEIKKTIF
ncbi:tRNA pseudouridine synthase-like 1 [Macrosteles quadrilineatus]|uniref:tRNA pseudouridine synthase-like 1 n=1 Tax=Macrosteles quadrilineatus TaxID=74068 RepID=UPI0023E29D4D|nr:tRNA pseudouridine synthase-like 1 [Macrosteles quadrilineatus]